MSQPKQEIQRANVGIVTILSTVKGPQQHLRRKSSAIARTPAADDSSSRIHRCLTGGYSQLRHRVVLPAHMAGGPERQPYDALQTILDLCIPEKELAKTRSQISFI
jgi:hypothetical protein